MQFQLPWWYHIVEMWEIDRLIELSDKIIDFLE